MWVYSQNQVEELAWQTEPRPAVDTFNWVFEVAGVGVWGSSVILQCNFETRIKSLFWVRLTEKDCPLSASVCRWGLNEPHGVNVTTSWHSCVSCSTDGAGGWRGKSPDCSLSAQFLIHVPVWPVWLFFPRVWSVLWPRASVHVTRVRRDPAALL